MPICLQTEYDKEQNLFKVVVFYPLGAEVCSCEEVMSISSFRIFCQRIEQGYTTGPFSHFFNPGNYRVISKRTKRGIVEYFRSVLRSFEQNGDNKV